MAVGLITWLDSVAMFPSVVIGVTREALELSAVAPAKLVDTVPVTVPRVVTPGEVTDREIKRDIYYRHLIPHWVFVYPVKLELTTSRQSASCLNNLYTAISSVV